MKKQILMLNHSTNCLDEILQVGKSNHDKIGLGYIINHKEPQKKKLPHWKKNAKALKNALVHELTTPCKSIKTSSGKHWMF